MARSTMAAIIARLRLLANDQAAEIWTDDDLQAFLDARRDEVRYLPLCPVESREPGTGRISYKTFRAEFGWWEAGAALELTDSRWRPLEPAETDNVNGRWSFGVEPEGRSVYITGFTYDIYGAAADACRARAASVANMVDAKEGDTDYKYSQGGRQWLAMASEYARKARIRTATLVRDDLAAPKD